MFIRSAWYVIAWDHEVSADAILQRTVLGESVIVYRLAEGSPVVMENRCCHRAAPLALGRKEGDCIRCLYHGLKFGPTGVCVEIPGQARIPPSARVKTYPAVQRLRWIWVWMGNAADADEALIPDAFSLQHPQWGMIPGYQKVAAHVLLITDNLLDFSHLSYVHEATFGGSTDIAEVIPEVTNLDGQGVRIIRRAFDTMPAPYHRKLKAFPGNVNRWWDYTLSISGVFMMSSGAQSVDKPAGDLEGALLFHSCQALTPETAESTHYFFSLAHNFSLDDPLTTAQIYESVVTALDEDRRIIEAQSHILRKNPQRPLVGINADTALVRYRRMVAAALAAEQTADGA